MAGCADVRELLALRLDGELDEAQVTIVDDHLERCAECAEIAHVMQDVADIGSGLAAIEPPQKLAAELKSSPCRLWLGLLFQAVDHEISQRNLERLLTHLEACPSCRRTWQDLTLVHQVGAAMVPASNLVAKCIAARDRKPEAPRILDRRLATAAAYVLAVVTSLIIGNPVTLARSQAAPAVERVAQQITEEVSDVAEQGRGEVRVMMWRVWKWGERTFDAVRDFVSRDSQTSDEPAPDDGSDPGEQT